MTSAPFTAKDLNAWHKAMTAKHGPVVPKFECVDGYQVSIQASRSHYSEPRDDSAWPYERFELGYPTAADEEIASYAEDADAPTGTVHAFVPVDNLLLVLAKHGGPSVAALSKAGV